MTRRQFDRIQSFWVAVRAAIKGSGWARRAAAVMLLTGVLFAGAAVWMTVPTQASHWVWKGWERMFGSSAPANPLPALAQPQSSGTSGNYTIIDEPSAGTSALQGTIVFAVNASGAMTGAYSNQTGVVHGFVYAKGAFTSFDAQNAGSSPPSGWFQGTTGIGIDTAGDVVGIYADNNNASHGFLRSAATGAITQFDDPNAPTATTSRGTYPMAINDAGQIVGFYTTGSYDTNSGYHGFVYSIANGAFTEIDDPSAGTVPSYQKQGTVAMAINASGTVTGYYADSDGNRHGFIYSAGNYTSFDIPGATTNTGHGGALSGTIPMSIDAAGDVVGSWTDSNQGRQGFIRSASGTITTFDAPGANTSSQSGFIGGTFPTRIDPTGSYIVGGYTDSSGLGHGFVYYLPLTGSGSFTTFTPPNMTTSTILPVGGVFGVNASGTVVGFYLDSNEVSHGFEYTQPQPLQFIPVTPCRVADTRNPNGPFGGPEPTARSTTTFDIPQSACHIPNTAVAYSLNVTVVPDASLNYLTLWPSGQAQPNVSTLNSDGRIKANAAIVPAGTNGGVSVYVTDPTQVILDIDGYFVPAGAPSALAFYPVTPCRVADTRSADGPLGGPYISGGSSRTFPILSSTCGIPSTAKAYSLNVTAVPHGPLNYLTLYPSPCTAAPPNVSTLNSSTGAVTANAAIVQPGNDGGICVYVSDPADVVLDIDGYFAPPATGGLSLYSAKPCRVIDTRPNAFTGTIVVGVPVDLQGSSCAPPSTAEAYVLNATVVPDGALNYLTLWPDGTTQPYVSTLNADDGAITSNMAIVPTNNGSIDAYANGTTNLILDLSGYFAP